MKTIQNLLTDFKCIGCKEQQHAITPSSTANAAAADGPNEKDQSTVKFKPIGVIRTDFPEKRAVPRQPICSKLPGLIELNKDVFNNPEHSLDRLSDFSHLWIIYHFHKNDAHAKAKVAPPRLGGERVGIFSTRSPHRPCPIGLSLVEIERIEGSNIYFYGTDMVDGTPVLDLKPYIPRYDSPVRNHFTGNEIFLSFSQFKMNAFIKICIFTLITDHPAIPTEEDCQEFDTREEPDGEETIHKNIQQTSAGATSMAATTNSVKVPHWIMNDTTLDVLFNQRATAQIDEFHINRVGFNF